MALAENLKRKRKNRRRNLVAFIGLTKKSKKKRKNKYAVNRIFPIKNFHFYCSPHILSTQRSQIAIASFTVVRIRIRMPLKCALCRFIDGVFFYLSIFCSSISSGNSQRAHSGGWHRIEIPYCTRALVDG